MESGTSFEDPIHVNYRGVDVYEPGPNTQGVAALVALKILEHFDINSMDPLGDIRCIIRHLK